MYHKKYPHPSKLGLLLATLLFLGSSLTWGEDYYKQEALFSKRPDPTQSVNHMTRCGPIGFSLDLIQPPFTMRIKAIEPGSPAEQTGKLKPGMIIESINGEKLADIDPRIQLGNMITKAEASDGVLKMLVADQPGGTTQEVVVRIPVLGKYSETWPMDCPKSDKIVRNFAEYLKKPKSDRGFGSLGMLFLLSTGDASDLDYVRKWARSKSKEKPSVFHTWHHGYGNLALCEYYLRTGDKEVLPAIQAVVDSALENESHGGWGNRNALAGLNYGGGNGHLNASSVPLATFLILAKECGANIPDEQFLRIVRHYYRWAGRGNISYGNGKPEGSYTDNGKNGKLAFTMAAASSLTPEGEQSVYARARDVSANFSFYSTSYMLHGHTGGGIGEIWRSAAMGLLAEKKPGHYRNFMDERRWHYELSRRFDGSFAILGGERYDNVNWGAGYAWTYTVPRKTLRLTGAPPSPYSVPYKLPELLWGTAEDQDFLSIEPIAYPDGSKPDFSQETLRDSGGMALLDFRRGKVSDADLRRYIRHPNLVTRTYFLDRVVERELPFVMEMLESDDARLRRLGLLAVGKNKDKFLTPETFDFIAARVEDPKEAWFVKEQALMVMGQGSPDLIVGKIDVILPYLEHEEWWLQHSALEAITTVVADKRIYKKVLPALAKLLETNHIYNLTAPLRWGRIPQYLRQAEPEVAELARKELGSAYTEFVQYEHPVPQVRNTVNPGLREDIAKTIVQVPGGYDTLYQIAKQRSPNAPLPYQELFLEADPSQFSPELKKEVAGLIKNSLIPRYIAGSRSILLRERANDAIKWGFYYREPRVFGLVDLYQRIGIDDYNWHDFGPEMTEMQWHYHSFDPPEKLVWDSPKPRYREVTFPKGMENWFDPSFNPAKHGWKQGKQPFGASNGKLVESEGRSCGLDFCRHWLPMSTLWEKEVLLLRGTFKYPEFKDDHRYRLLIGGMSHVGQGEGYKIYINGKEFFDRDRGVGRREGAKPISKHIDKSWWPEFEKGEVDIAVISFMGVHRGQKSRQMSVWIQEMKLPELSEEEIVMSATELPMKSIGWQALQDPDDNDKRPEAGKFRWDGKFNRNQAVEGQWKTLSVVTSPDDFKPEDQPDTKNWRIKEMTFKPGGKTHELLWIYSGDTLMDLNGNEALRMQTKSIGGKDYLFVEQGRFHEKHGHTWQPNWEVLARVD